MYEGVCTGFGGWAQPPPLTGGSRDITMNWEHLSGECYLPRFPMETSLADWLVPTFWFSLYPFLVTQYAGCWSCRLGFHHKSVTTHNVSSSAFAAAPTFFFNRSLTSTWRWNDYMFLYAYLRKDANGALREQYLFVLERLNSILFYFILEQLM